MIMMSFSGILADRTIPRKFMLSKEKRKISFHSTFLILTFTTSKFRWTTTTSRRRIFVLLIYIFSAT